jgi:hypothetical protein
VTLQAAPPAHFCESLEFHLHKHRRDSTYILAGVPRFAICATSSRRWAVSKLIARITAFSQLSMVRCEMFIVVEALLRIQVSVSRNAPWKNDTHPGGDCGDKKEYDCLDLHDDGYRETDDIYKVKF